jgi:hypothetical protein
VNQQELDEMVRDIARRVFAEERAGRHVDDQRLTWAAEVLDQRRPGGSNEVEKPEVEAT